MSYFLCFGFGFGVYMLGIISKKQIFREPRKFIEAVLEFDRKRGVLSVHVIVIRSERVRKSVEEGYEGFMHLELEIRRKCTATSMRHKSHKRRTSGDVVDEINEVFKFPRIDEQFLREAILRICCIVSYQNRSQKSFEGKLRLKEIVEKRIGVRHFKIVELGNIELYSIEEEESDEDESEKYDWIISV